MASFKGVLGEFRVNLVNYDGGTERVSVQIGLDGLKIISTADNRTIRSYDLSHISRWQSRDTSLYLYTKTPSDVEERQTTLQGDPTTIRNVLDTLTSCCLQLCEILESKKTDTSSQETANSLHQLVASNGKKSSKSAQPSADDVEYWKSPDKEGWLQSQGEHIKSWRRRWFVIKQGYLFRFMDSKVSESTKPRGVVDLSKVQDVKPLAGKANTIQLKTSTGGVVQYIADTETEVVEWISAIESTIQKICKQAAGVEDEPAPKSTPSKSSSSSKTDDWVRQLERNFDNMNVTSSSSNHRSSGPTMVNIVGYDALSPSGGTGSVRDSAVRYGGGDTAPSYSSMQSAHSGSLYGSVPSVQAISNDTMLNYGGGGDNFRPEHDPYLNSARSLSQPSSYSQPSASAYGAASYSAQSAYTSQPAAAAASYSNYNQAYNTPGASLIDQLPPQPVSYPYMQHHAPQAAPAPNTWQVHYTGDGRPYYYNTATGVTQWEAPPGM